MLALFRQGAIQTGFSEALLTERELRTKSNEYNAATALTMGYQEIRNSAENWDTIMKAFEEGRARDLSEEPKKLLQPVIITGSGPSLDESIEKLKEWKGGIICHYSQALTLMYYGIEPDYIVALDAICNWEGLSGVDWSKTKTKLVLHPGVWPSLVANWPNEMLLYRQNIGKPDTFGVNEQKIMFCKRHGTLEDALANKIAFEPLIKTELTMFACTPPGQLFVAQVLQYGPVFLTGCDFAYHSGKERFTNYVMGPDGWKAEPHPLTERPFIITNNGLKTEPLHLYYKKNFLSAARLSMQLVYTTDKGALTEIPFISMDDVIKYQGHKVPSISPEVRAKKYERYLASINCFVINYSNGSSFVEVHDPIPDLTEFMRQKNRVYYCENCGQVGTSKDDICHDGAPCEICHKPKMKRQNPVDIEENLKRIRALIEYCKEEEKA